VKISLAGRALKRAMDLGITLLLAVPALLFTGIVILAIRLESPGPVLFWQERIGMKGKPFKMVKFRSKVVDAEDQKAALEMMNEASAPNYKIKNDPRQTRVGRINRR
jgi:lipopolysaccharide/colanic/teichoic acid biosynthesis glycosyltransferase